MRTAAEIKVRDAMFAIIHEATHKIEAAETGKTIDPDASVQANIRRKERQISFNKSIIEDTRVMLAKLDLLTR
jgi:hypothetical protein